MASKSGVYVIATLVTYLGFFVFSGEAIKCYECTSDRHYDCGDPFNFTHFPLVDCEHKRGYQTYGQSYGVCRKTVQRVNGERVIERGCAWERHQEREGPCALAGSTYAVIEHCSTCYNDACNGGIVVPVPTVFTCIATTLLCWLGARLL